MYLLVINYNISSGWPTTRSIAQDSKAGGMCAFQQSSVQTGVKRTSSKDIHEPFRSELQYKFRMAHYTVNCSRFESWRDVRFSTIIRPNGREDDFQHGYPCAFRRETNSAKSSAKSPAVRPGLPSFLACPHARKHSATRQNT